MRPLLVVPALLLAACEAAPSGEVPSFVFGHCTYTSRFSKLDECLELRGTAWTADEAEARCADEGAELEEGPCPSSYDLGACVLPGEEAKVPQVKVQSDDAGDCVDNERGCTLFAQGTWLPGPECGGIDPDDYWDPEASVYLPAEHMCAAPVDDVPGQGEDGQVCFFQHMSGCVEEGRRFEDYASCDVIRTQRPYGPVPPSSFADTVDPRLDDGEYVAELAWVTSQVQSCSCVCCHDSRLTPDGGAGVFDVAHPGNWMNTFSEYGLAFGANAFDTSLLGAYDPAVNNGFGRSDSGFPSTDQARMKRFFAQELVFRGSSVDEFADYGPQPAVFAAQAQFDVEPCDDGEGVARDGTITWRGGRARYVQLLESGSANPVVPPNLDLPPGTLWRLDVEPDATPVKTGEVRYGTLVDGAGQGFPADGVAPTPLEDGRDYYLYVAADIGVPLTRCTFTFPRG